MELIEHLEKYLGPITTGRSLKHPSYKLQVVKFENQPEQDIMTFSTLGLSKYNLKMSDNQYIRQELLVAVSKEYKDEEVASFLLSFAEHVIASKRCLLRGDVIGPGPPIIEGVQANGVYASVPVIFDSEFYEAKGNVNTIFVWLIPVLTEEIEFIHEYGWSNFEDKLEQVYCNFWDLNRSKLENIS